MAYWIHYNGGIIAHGEDAITNCRSCRSYHKDEFFKVDHISSLTSMKLVNRIYYECGLRLGKHGLPKNICAAHLEDPIILNYSVNMRDYSFSDLTDEQIAAIRLEHLSRDLDRNEAAFLRRCGVAAKERDAIIDAFENDTSVIEESPVLVDDISLTDTGDFDFDFEFDSDSDTDDAITFTKTKSEKQKDKQSNDLKLF